MFRKCGIDRHKWIYFDEEDARTHARTRSVSEYEKEREGGGARGRENEGGREGEPDALTDETH